MTFNRILHSRIFYLFLGGLIAFIFNCFLNIYILEKQNCYKKTSEKQNFVIEYSQLLQKRIYLAEVFFWNVQGDARKDTIIDSWQRYKEATVIWNEKLQTNYILLNRYFPKGKYVVKNYSKYLQSKKSFCDFMKSELQSEMITIHAQLLELKKKIIADKPVNKISLEELQGKIEKLHARLTNYSDALSRAIG